VSKKANQCRGDEQRSREDESAGSLDPWWEADLQRIALGADGLDDHGLARRRQGSGDRFRREVEEDAEDVGVLHVEETLPLQVVGLAALCAPQDLLAR
jgi:hypothetical protein